MKIMYCTNQMYEHGGIEKILAQKINHWIEQHQYNIILCTSEQQNRNCIYSLNSKTNHVDLGINYNRSKSYFHPNNLIKSLQHYLKLKRFIKICKPDIIISVNFTPEQYFIPFLSNTIPTVKEFHSSGVTIHFGKSILDKCKQFLFKLLNRYTIKVVLNSDEIQYYPFDGIKVIPNFIIPQYSKISHKENFIIAAGRIAPVKQFDHLIEAWSMISDEVPDWKVHIYGEGDEVLTQQLQHQIDQQQVPRIELKGVTQQLDKKMQEASIFAMTSKTECFPMVLLEAQNAGMAVLSYDCPNGPRNIITHNKNGILVTDQNVNHFADELKRLIQNTTKQKEIQLHAHQNINQFSEETVMKMWDVLFKSLK
jgi:glycosyltransferase involved in cell wall biosynthesis